MIAQSIDTHANAPIPTRFGALCLENGQKAPQSIWAPKPYKADLLAQAALTRTVHREPLSWATMMQALRSSFQEIPASADHFFARLLEPVRDHAAVLPVGLPKLTKAEEEQLLIEREAARRATEDLDMSLDSLYPAPVSGVFTDIAPSADTFTPSKLTEDTQGIEPHAGDSFKRHLATLPADAAQDDAPIYVQYMSKPDAPVLGNVETPHFEIQEDEPAPEAEPVPLAEANWYDPTVVKSAWRNRLESVAAPLEPLMESSDVVGGETASVEVAQKPKAKAKAEAVRPEVVLTESSAYLLKTNRFVNNSIEQLTRAYFQGAEAV